MGKCWMLDGLWLYDASWSMIHDDGYMYILVGIDIAQAMGGRIEHTFSPTYCPSRVVRFDFNRQSS